MFVAIVNGHEGGEERIRIGSVARLRASLLTEAGVPLDVTGDTVTMELYDKEDRRNASSQSIALPVATAAAGYVEAAIDQETITADPGTYYGYIKRFENSASVYSFSRKPVKVILG